MRILLFTFIFIQLTATAQSSLQTFYSNAQAAHKAGNYSEFYQNIKEALKLHPYHQGILYQAGIAACLTEKHTEAIQYLKEAILIKADYDLQINDFASMANTIEFKNLLKLQEQLKKPIIQSDTLYVLNDRSLHLEALAVDQKNGNLYGTSIRKRKIIQIDKNGEVTDFTKPEQDGLTAVFGIKVDNTTNSLWVCASPMPEMQHYDSTAKSAVFQYDLPSKRLLAKYELDNQQGGVFGDLVISPIGDVIVSDSKNNILYRVNTKTKKLDPFFTSDEFWNIQGIAFTPDNRYLFISDYIKGLYRLNINTKELVAINKKIEASLKSIDGLIFYQNSVIAIQNSVTPMRVMQYKLNDGLDSVVDYAIIDRAHPAFNEPTNGCIVNNKLIYIANSQWSGYTNEYSPKPTEELQDVVILQFTLERN
jgi:DNA-binding beta-propeller fold protein YncE